MKDNQNLNKDEVRKAPGAEKIYSVDITIPITGDVTLCPLTISASNEKEARNKALELVDGVYNIDSEESEIKIVEEEINLMEDESEWTIKITPKEKE